MEVKTKFLLVRTKRKLFGYPIVIERTVGLSGEVSDVDTIFGKHGEAWQYNVDTWCLGVHNVKIANDVAKLLQLNERYKNGEEALYRLSLEQLKTVLFKIVPKKRVRYLIKDPSKAWVTWLK